MFARLLLLSAGSAGAISTSVCDLSGQWVMSWAHGGSPAPNTDNMTIAQTGRDFTVDCATESWGHASGILSDAFAKDPSNWDGVLSVTFPAHGSAQAQTHGGSADRADAGCAKVWWQDGSVWCKGLKIGDTDCGGGTPPPSPPPAPTPPPPTPPPTPFVPPFANTTLRLHIVEHTHDDVGWIKNIPDYYTSEVRNIIDTATAGLSRDRARKFIYVEVAFFQMWWNEQNSTWRQEVARQVADGQLQFTNAGWCMSDEATSHFVDQVDQMTLGHLWLQAQFGRNERTMPKVAWHIDPFGHSTATAFLFAKMGFDMFQFGRSPGNDKLLPKAYDGNQFVWRPMQSSFAPAQQDLWTYFHDGYGGGPPSSCGKKGGCTAADMAQYAGDRFDYLADPSCPVEIDLYGHDFAVPDWNAADDAVKFFAAHPEYGINATYSTPTEFARDMHSCNRSWDVFAPPNNDFFPYWTGFFTSQPVFKAEVRAASSLFHLSRLVHFNGALRGGAAAGGAAAAPYTDMATRLNVLWQAVGVTQHHDGVTGTSPEFTYVEYRRRLGFGSALAREAVAELVRSGSGHGEQQQQQQQQQQSQMCVAEPVCDNKGATDADLHSKAQSHCVEGGAALCPAWGLQDPGSGMVLRVLNPLAWARSDIVRVRVPLDVTQLVLQVVDSATGAAVPSQTQPGVNSTALVTFRATGVAPLGSKDFHLSSTVAPPVSPTPPPAPAPPTPPPTPVPAPPPSPAGPPFAQCPGTPILHKKCTSGCVSNQPGGSGDSWWTTDVKFHSPFDAPPDVTFIGMWHTLDGHTARNACCGNTFNETALNVHDDGFTVSLQRTDNYPDPSGWGQQLHVQWMACPPKSGGSAHSDATGQQQQQQQQQQQEQQQQQPQQGGGKTTAALAPFALENAHVRLNFGADGSLSSITNKDYSPALVTAASLALRWYNASRAGDDGAYDFHTDKDHKDAIAFGTETQLLGLERGAVFDEVRVGYGEPGYGPVPGVELVVRLFHDDASSANSSSAMELTGFFEVEARVGPVNVADGWGKDVIVQLNTSIASGGRFLTDSSGMEMMQRQLGVGTFGQSLDPTQPGANYYPTTALAALHDGGEQLSQAKQQLVWISDRAQGCGSMHNGSLEKMVYRRLLKGDGKGMNVPLNSTDAVRTMHRIVFAAPDDATALARQLYWRSYHPLASVALLPQQQSREQPLESPLASVAAAPDSPLAAALPPSIHLQTLHVLSNNWSLPAPYDVPSPRAKTTGNLPYPPADPSALADGTVLLRLHHIYAAGEGTAALRAPVTLDLGALFAAQPGCFEIDEVVELTLSATQPLAELTRLVWRTNSSAALNSSVNSSVNSSGSGWGGGAAEGMKMPVTVTNMDIRTFALRFKPPSSR